MNARATATLLLLAALPLGCRPDDQETQSISAEDVRAARAALPAELREALDAGNRDYRAARDAVRAGDAARADSLYRAALARYREAARIDGDAAPAWFGIYMTEQALGNADAAADALRRARSAAPGATLMHPEDGEEEP